MMYLKTIAIMLAMVACWWVVRSLARRFAAHHPEFGEHREEGEGCGCGNHACGTSSCKRETH